MMVAKFLFVVLLLAVEIHGQWITQKIAEHMVARDHDYWVIKTNGRVNKPSFPAFIRIYNTYMSKNVFHIDCSSSRKILYLANEIIFLTTGHLWNEGDSYYITLDEGVLYSTKTQNSSKEINPKFWQFMIPRPLF